MRIFTTIFLALAALSYIMVVVPFNIPWWKITGKVLLAIDRFKIITTEFPIDFSAGACQLSDPDKEKYTMARYRKKRVNGTEVDEPDDDYNKPQLLLAHQMGRKIVKSLPDPALLGILVLILSELLNRETKTNFVRLPPPLRAILNESAVELDQKLEFLSAMQWNVEPFLRTELENLQKQPLELLDKYIVTDILPRVDKEISPILNSLLGNPSTVSSITSNIKDIIQVASVVLVQSGKDWSWEEISGWKDIKSRSLSEVKDSPLEGTTSALLDGVDTLGDLAERAIEDWNNILEDLKSASKAKTVLDLRQKEQDDSLWGRLTQSFSADRDKGVSVIDTEIYLGAERRAVGVSSRDTEGTGSSFGVTLNANTTIESHNGPLESVSGVRGSIRTNIGGSDVGSSSSPTADDTGVIDSEQKEGEPLYRVWHPSRKTRTSAKRRGLSPWGK